MNQLGKHINISHLLWKHLNDDLSPKEQKELDALFRNDLSLKIWFEKFRVQEYIDQRLDEHYSIDLENKWKTFSLKTNNKNKLKKISHFMLRIAAVMLPVAIVVYFIFQFGWNETSTLAHNNIMPGTSKATLTLSSGEVIKLEAKIADTLYDVGTEIKLTGTKLVYAKNYNIREEKKYETNILNVPHGGEFQLTLPDGTRVWVNSKSSLKYLIPFGEKNRDIEMTGEAYFEVAHNPDMPFRVKTKNGFVKVLGTSFNIRTYDSSEGKNITTLAEGSIALKMGNKEIYLKPGEQAIFTEANQNLKVNKVNVKKFLAWKDGQYLFVNDRLEDIINDLARWYDIEIFYETESAKEMLFTCYISRDKDIGKILELLQKTRRVKFEINDNYVLIKKM